MDQPLRSLCAEEIRDFERDGAICARGLFDAKWVERMAKAVDRIVAHPTFYGGNVSSQEQGFSGDLFVWKGDDDFRDFIYNSPAALIANQLLKSSRVNFFYDQLFVKPPGCHVATPWHQDLTFWPIEGSQICSIWMSFDLVTRESSGLEFVRGSQRWKSRYKAVTPTFDPYMRASDLEDAPDVDARREEFELLCWDMEPGDCLLFDALVLHGSTGNYSTERSRRAFSTRWTGDDVRFAPRHPTMPLFWPHGLEPGDALGGPLFPQVLPEPIASEGARRAEGPEPPDPQLLARVAREVRGHLAQRTANGRSA